MQDMCVHECTLTVSGHYKYGEGASCSVTRRCYGQISTLVWKGFRITMQATYVFSGDVLMNWGLTQRDYNAQVWRNVDHAFEEYEAHEKLITRGNR
jgi:hypothetical protein